MLDEPSSNTIPDTQPTWVYRLGCSHGGRLYAGSTQDLGRRLAQHAATKSWWPEVVYIGADLYPSRSIAMMVELMIIANYRPKYNIQGQPPPPVWPERVGTKWFTNGPDGLELEYDSACDRTWVSARA